MMGRPGEVALLLALLVLLGSMHGARAYDCDLDNDGVPDHVDPDDDNDGIPDEEDDDDDNDGIRDIDKDSDNDGVPDYVDTDNDNDGIPDSLQCDDDGDSIRDNDDRDDDNDGIPDSLDNDDDNDGIDDDYDYEDYEDYDDYEYYYEENLEEEGYQEAHADARGNYLAVGSLDFDSDGIRDDLDFDDDNDGIDDDEDPDDDNDGIDDDEDPDDDNDGVPDELEVNSKDEGGSPPTGRPQNQEFTPMCNNENCWIRVDWEPPTRDTWMSCLLGYRVGFRRSDERLNPRSWRNNDEGTHHRDLRSGQKFFFEEAEGANHSLTIRNLDFATNYEVVIDVFNPFGGVRGEYEYEALQVQVATPPEPCRDASVPEPDKFVDSSENSLSVHLDQWQDANCPTVYFTVEQRERGQQEWSSVSRNAKPGGDILISNLSPATWYQIKVTGERPVPDPTSLEFEIATLAADGSGFTGCVIEKDVKYSGNNLESKRGINQETCAALCFKKPACTHWTHNPTYLGGKCWMKTSDGGRARSTTGSSSGQKACGGRGFSLPEVTSTAAAAMASCSPPWISLSTGCYLFQDWNSTWYESRRECKQSGGFLVEIDSEEEQNALMNEIAARGWDGETHFGFWIGLTDIFHDGTWVWDNLGRPLDFSYWARGEPNNWNGIQHCAAINLEWADGRWDDVGCEAVMIEHRSYGDTYGHICEASGTSMTYTREDGVKWQNEFGKTSHMKVLMVHSVADCEKECTATVPCIAYTFIPGMEICALKAPKDATATVDAAMGAEIISGRLEGERPAVGAKALDSTICLPCLPACKVEEGTKLSGYNLYPLAAETQEECAAACLREPECHYWTHNSNVGRCWLKKSDLGKGPSSKGSNSGQKSCGVTEDDILSGLVLEDGCECTSETTAACSIEENTKYSGHNLYTTKGIKVGNMAGCASLCFNDNKCKFWTFNPKVSKCWMKTSDQGRSPSTKGSRSGQKACGAPGALPEEPASLPTSGDMNSPNFPFDYPNDLHERKTIEVAKGNIINIYFTDFELEKPDEVDYVEITDGDGTLLGHFGAQHYSDNLELNFVKGERGGKRKGIKISNITSITETVHVLFHTDESVTRRGWHLEWSSSPSLKREQPTHGVLTSPNYLTSPQANYPHNLDSVQEIQVPEGNTIRIWFDSYEVERKYDSLTITEKDGTTLAHYDGWEVSDDDWRDEIVSKTDMVTVRFRTDSSGSGFRGWRLHWGTIRDEESTPKNGVLTSPRDARGLYPNSHDSTQTIQVAEGKIIKISFWDFNTESGRDTVEVVDGDGTNLAPLSLCLPQLSGMSGIGRCESATFTSNTNVVHVKFHTDNARQRTGWRLEWSER